MGKSATPRQLADNEARAFSKSIRVSPQKLNLVAQSIRGKPCEEALNQLTFSRRRIAVEVKKVLQSAIAKAEATEACKVARVGSKRFGRNEVQKRDALAALERAFESRSIDELRSVLEEAESSNVAE